MDINSVDDFTRHYLVAAMWSTNDESTEAGGEPFDLNYDLDDIAPGAVAEAYKHCQEFQAAAAPLLEQAYLLYQWHPDAPTPQCSAGHDFWLTSAGHGVGFWDRGFGPLGYQLSALCGYHTAFPPFDTVLGDDGKIYLE